MLHSCLWYITIILSLLCKNILLIKDDNEVLLQSNLDIVLSILGPHNFVAQIGGVSKKHKYFVNYDKIRKSETL